MEAAVLNANVKRPKCGESQTASLPRASMWSFLATSMRSRYGRQPSREFAESIQNNNSPLIDCYSLPSFQVGKRPGSFDSCGLHSRLDYILISNSWLPSFGGGGVFREGLWGSRVTRPTARSTYPDSSEQVSDHAAVFRPKHLAADTDNGALSNGVREKNRSRKSNQFCVPRISLCFMSTRPPLSLSEPNKVQRYRKYL